jgi:predicted XRE-type DNA-binding protein
LDRAAAHVARMKRQRNPGSSSRMARSLPDCASLHPGYKPAMKTKLSVKRGSGNVFADLGFERPEEELLKAQLVREIRDILKRRKLTQAKAADLLGLKQPDVSALITGRVHKFSLERLLRCVRRLDRMS